MKNTNFLLATWPGEIVSRIHQFDFFGRLYFFLSSLNDTTSCQGMSILSLMNTVIQKKANDMLHFHVVSRRVMLTIEETYNLSMRRSIHQSAWDLTLKKGSFGKVTEITNRRGMFTSSFSVSFFHDVFIRQLNLWLIG